MVLRRHISELPMSAISRKFHSIVQRNIVFLVFNEGQVTNRDFTSSSSRSSFSSSKGFSSKLRSMLFCECISLGRVDGLRIFKQLKVSGSLKESFLRGLGVSKPRGLPGPGLAGVDGSDEAIAVLLREFLSMVNPPIPSHVRFEFSRVRSCGHAVIHRATSHELHFFYLDNPSLRGTKARIVYSESSFELISACRGRKERKQV